MGILTAAPRNFQEKIRSELTEGLQLSYNDIMPTVVHLRASMAGSGAYGAATLPLAASDTVRIPGDYNFLATEVHAHVAMAQVSQEGVGSSGLMLLSGIRNRTLAKALSAFVSLVNADRNDLTFVENNIQNSSANGAVISNLCLASIMPLAGGEPIKLIDQNYVAPLIVPANERLRMIVTLTNAEASLNQTEYGLTLIGAMVRARAG
jgi:hypothetical protein